MSQLESLGYHVEKRLDAADDPARSSVYMTVTGTSAESGDDGEGGRGNRVNGLITPLRPMSIEAAAGKNPLSHVGKLYNITSNRIAAAIVNEIPHVLGAQCYLVSQIGAPVTEPAIAYIEIWLQDPAALGAIRPEIEALASDHIARTPLLWQSLLAHEIVLDRWPL